jgi:hypothetical protein
MMLAFVAEIMVRAHIEAGEVGFAQALHGFFRLE